MTASLLLLSYDMPCPFIVVWALAFVSIAAVAQPYFELLVRRATTG